MHQDPCAQAWLRVGGVCHQYARARARAHTHTPADGRGGTDGEDGEDAAVDGTGTASTAVRKPTYGTMTAHMQPDQYAGPLLQGAHPLRGFGSRASTVEAVVCLCVRVCVFVSPRPSNQHAADDGI